MAIIIPLKSVFDDKGIREAQRSFGKIGSSLRGALGVLGAGLSISGLVSIGKAAADDAKSLALMTTALKNATGATDTQISAAEQFVQSLSNQYGVLDDQLRPALSILAASYGDLGVAQSMMTQTLDLAAYAQVDATTAAGALAKAHNGNFKALNALTKNALTTAVDKFGRLKELTQGSAEAAAKTDPWMKLSVIFDNFKEMLGQYILPYVQQFSDWLSSDAGQTTIQNIATAFGSIMKSVFNVVTWLSDNTWLVKTIANVIILVKVMQGMWAVSKAIYAVTKAIGMSEMVIAAIKASPGMTAAVAGAAAVTTAGLIWWGIDQVMGDMPAIEVPVAPRVDRERKPEVQNVDPNALALKTAGQKTETLAEKLARLYKKLVENVKASMKQIHDSIVSAFDITQMGTSGSSIARNMDKFVARLRQFAVYIAQLKARGLNPALLMQIVNAGPENGLRAAKALAGDPSLVNQANVAYGQVNALATSIAGNAVRAQYAPVYNIRVDGGVGSGATVGKAIVEAIKAYERTSGKVWTPAT